MEGFWVSSAIHAIKALSYVYDLLTFPVYLILQRPWEKRKASRRIKARPISKSDGQITYRSVDSPASMHIMLEREKVDTLEKMFLWVVKMHGGKRCLGTRQILAEEDEPQPNGRVFKKVKSNTPIIWNFHAPRVGCWYENQAGDPLWSSSKQILCIQHADHALSMQSILFGSMLYSLCSD